MEKETEHHETDRQHTADDSPEEGLETSGYIERTVLNHLAGSAPEPRRPVTVGDVLEDIAAVIRRGDYGNVGPPGATSGTVRQSTIRRAFTQLREKGLVTRVEELDAEQLASDRFDLGTCDGNPEDPASYSHTTDDARVTDWILTEQGVREIERLDARYRAELDELAARYGRPYGETTERIEA